MTRPPGGAKQIHTLPCVQCRELIISIQLTEHEVFSEMDVDNDTDCLALLGARSTVQ